MIRGLSLPLGSRQLMPGQTGQRVLTVLGWKCFVLNMKSETNQKALHILECCLVEWESLMLLWCILILMWHSSFMWRLKQPYLLGPHLLRMPHVVRQLLCVRQLHLLSQPIPGQPHHLIKIYKVRHPHLLRHLNVIKGPSSCKESSLSLLALSCEATSSIESVLLFYTAPTSEVLRQWGSITVWGILIERWPKCVRHFYHVRQPYLVRQHH